MVTVPFEAVNVAWSFALDPTDTLPKLSVAGDTASWAPLPPVPVPETSIVSGEFSASLLMVITPVVLPDALGEKIIGNSMLDLASIWTGNGKLPNENALPFSDFESTVTVREEVLTSHTEAELDFPIFTLPKS
jgi:hypothetical protein